MPLVRLASESDFAGWRTAARALRSRGVPPEETRWEVSPGGEACSVVDPGPPFTVPARFVALAQEVFRHRAPERFGLLYRLLWRLAERPDLLDDPHDPDVARAGVLAREATAGRNRLAAPGISEPPPVMEAAPMAAQTPVSERVRRAALRASRDAPYEAGTPTTLEEVAAAVDACRRCDLWRHATRGVPGEGPARARLMLVGEQPGDQEDLVGRPFVGPAGGVLDSALAEAGVPRPQVFVTNAVRHFKHELRGKRRLHKTPNAGEVEACRWWTDAERRIVRPRVIVAMGATAALAVFGRPTPIGANRGRAHQLADQAQGVVTYHPSYLLRVPDAAAKARAFAEFVDDLKLAWKLAR